MQFDLRDVDFGSLEAPAGYRLHAWRPSILAEHAKVKYESFRNEMDANVFPCLGDPEGCHRLMREISRRAGFVPEATWLLTHQASADSTMEPIATVQGISDNPSIGLIQNIGVVQEYRGLGLGSLIVRKSLEGFQSFGAKIVTLEVTTQNEAAIRLYQRLGFTIQKTVYKSINVTA